MLFGLEPKGVIKRVAIAAGAAGLPAREAQLAETGQQIASSLALASTCVDEGELFDRGEGLHQQGSTRSHERPKDRFLKREQA